MRALRIVVMVVALLALALPATATHSHVRMTGSGACVVLGGNGAESDVHLPHADSFAENRQHPLHVNVHLGEAGTRKGRAVVWVQGSAAALANCDGYVND